MQKFVSVQLYLAIFIMSVIPSVPNSTVEENGTSGSCLCRAVQFKLTGQPRTKVLCHCDNCGRATGVGFMANNFYSESVSLLVTFLPFIGHYSTESLTIHVEQLEMISSATIKSYVDGNTESGAKVTRQFCGNCGSPLFATNETIPGFLVVSSGSLERIKGKEWEPDVEFYCRDRRRWLSGVKGLEGTKKYETMFEK